LDATGTLCHDISEPRLVSDVIWSFFWSSSILLFNELLHIQIFLKFCLKNYRISTDGRLKQQEWGMGTTLGYPLVICDIAIENGDL